MRWRRRRHRLRGGTWPPPSTQSPSFSAPARVRVRVLLAKPSRFTHARAARLSNPLVALSLSHSSSRRPPRSGGAPLPLPAALGKSPPRSSLRLYVSPEKREVAWQDKLECMGDPKHVEVLDESEEREALEEFGGRCGVVRGTTVSQVSGVRGSRRVTTVRRTCR